MPVPAAFVAGGLLRAGRALAKSGRIRGAVGRLLKQAASPGAILSTGVAVATQGTFGSVGHLPVYPGSGPRQLGAGSVLVRGGGTAIVRGGGAVVRAIGRKSWPRRIASLIAAGLAFEVGDRIIDAVTGKDITPTRRMNYANGKALSRSIRRMEGASKQYAKVLRATTKGIKKCGYTITPKKRAKRCA